MIHYLIRVLVKSPGALLIGGGLAAIFATFLNAVCFPDGAIYGIPGLWHIGIGPLGMQRLVLISISAGGLAVFAGLCRFVLELYPTEYPGGG